TGAARLSSRAVAAIQKRDRPRSPRAGRVREETMATPVICGTPLDPHLSRDGVSGRRAVASSSAFGIAAAAIVLATGAPASARITALTIERSVPPAGGVAFGAVGPYLHITGIAKGELDPADPRNRVIVNLDKAPRNAAGRVEYEVEFDIMRPADPAKGS